MKDQSGLAYTKSGLIFSINSNAFENSCIYKIYSFLEKFWLIFNLFGVYTYHFNFSSNLVFKTDKKLSKNIVTTVFEVGKTCVGIKIVIFFTN